MINQEGDQVSTKSKGIQQSHMSGHVTQIGDLKVKENNDNFKIIVTVNEDLTTWEESVELTLIEVAALRNKLSTWMNAKRSRDKDALKNGT